MTTISPSTVTISLLVMGWYFTIEFDLRKSQNFGTNLAKYVGKRGGHLFCRFSARMCHYVDDKCKYGKYTYSLEKCHLHMTSLFILVS